MEGVGMCQISEGEGRKDIYIKEASKCGVYMEVIKNKYLEN